MDAKAAHEQMMRWVRLHSGIEQHRHYLGLSTLGRCPRLLYDQFRDGKGEASDRAHLNCLSGYMVHDKVLDMLSGAGVCGPGDERSLEIVAPFDARVRGHVDGWTPDGEPIEIKSMDAAQFAEFRRDHRVPHDYYWQIQGYLRYAPADRALFVAVSREAFDFEFLDVDRNDRTGDKLELKAKFILKGIDENRAPQCDCGRCAASERFGPSATSQIRPPAYLGRLRRVAHNGRNGHGICTRQKHR